MNLFLDPPTAEDAAFQAAQAAERTERERDQMVEDAFISANALKSVVRLLADETDPARILYITPILDEIRDRLDAAFELQQQRLLVVA